MILRNKWTFEGLGSGTRNESSIPAHGRSKLQTAFHSQDTDIYATPYLNASPPTPQVSAVKLGLGIQDEQPLTA
jgi:hypothetical protein